MIARLMRNIQVRRFEIRKPLAVMTASNCAGAQLHLHVARVRIRIWLYGDGHDGPARGTQDAMDLPNGSSDVGNMFKHLGAEDEINRLGSQGDTVNASLQHPESAGRIRLSDTPSCEFDEISVDLNSKHAFCTWREKPKEITAPTAPDVRCGLATFAGKDLFKHYFFRGRTHGLS